uniref:Reverse transcriptase domain-containing protein n=1 Tax=Heterorhabditis bacteriophora TaxID=37862 RepID=A0A1I7WUH4_HETBA
MTLDKYCNWTGLRRPEKFDKASKKLMIGMMERTLIERIARLKNKKLGLCGKLDKNNQNGKPRLLMPTVKAVDDTFSGIVRDIASEGHVTDKDNLICDEQRVIIEQLLDEMLAFLSKEDNPNEVTECAERTLTRMQTSSVIANCCDFNNYNTKQRLKARQSRARLIRCESYPSVLKKLYKSSDTSHEVEWGRNVFSAGREYHNERKTLRRSKKSQEFNLRLEQMNHRVDEQICLEEEVLDFFDKFLKIYDPNGHFKMTLDMERDYEDGDSEENIRQKRYQRLRYVLMLPPGERVRDKKPDFGDNCSSIINNPSEIAMNNLMTGLSPFWKGPMLPSNKKVFILQELEKGCMIKMRTLYRLKTTIMIYYIYIYIYMGRNNRHSERISPPPVSNFNGTSVISPTGISRRTLSRLKDKSVQYLGTVNNQPAKPQVFLLDSMEDENVATLRAHASVSREILATAFKAIRQTTLMMVQSRFEILNVKL